MNYLQQSYGSVEFSVGVGGGVGVGVGEVLEVMFMNKLDYLSLLFQLVQNIPAFENNQRSIFGFALMPLSTGSITFRIDYLAIPLRNVTASQRHIDKCSRN